MATNRAPATQGEAANITRHLQGVPADKQRRAKMLDELLAALAGGPDRVTEYLTARFAVLREDFVAQLEHLKEQL
jgi:hypothetical protein